MIVLSAVLLSAVVCTLVQAQPVTPQCFGVVHAHAEAVGAINVYFNNSALHQYALPDNRANSCINLEERLLHRLSQG